MDAGKATTRERNPALDGLRGVALAGMLAWHAEIAWIAGGFARMTIFFVLSGFLATRSYLRRPRQGFVAFWRRRTLRLLPITLVGVGTAIVTTIVAGSVSTRESLAGDAASVLTYTSNWRFLADDQHYGSLFERDSAFQHYWSLSIEEQAFVLLPLILAAAAWVARRLRVHRGDVTGLAAVSLLAVPLLIGHTPDQVYFGTHIRLGEFLAGSWLAFALQNRTLGADERATRTIRRAGHVSLPVLLVVMVTIERDQPWLYEGGMGLFVVPVVAVIAAAVTRDPVLDATLGLRPFRVLGRAALSIYALHWPIYLLCDRFWPTAVDRRYIVPVELTVAVVIGLAVYQFVERPLLPRRTVTSTPRRYRLEIPLPALAAGAVALAVVAAVVPTPSRHYDFERAQQAFHEQPIIVPIAPRVGAPAPKRVGVFGGSSALQYGLGLPSWADGTDGWTSVVGEARLGCGILAEGLRAEARNPDGTAIWVEVPATCAGWTARWTAAAAETKPDVAIVFFGVWELADWQSADGTLTQLGDPEFDAAIVRGLRSGVAALRRAGVADVVLATTPPIVGGHDHGGTSIRGLGNDVPSRLARFNELVVEVAAATDATLWDFGHVIGRLRPDETRRLIPDGVHPTWDAAISLWSNGLGDDLATIIEGG